MPTFLGHPFLVMPGGSIKSSGDSVFLNTGDSMFTSTSPSSEPRCPAPQSHSLRIFPCPLSNHQEPLDRVFPAARLLLCFFIGYLFSQSQPRKDSDPHDTFLIPISIRPSSSYSQSRTIIFIKKLTAQKFQQPTPSRRSFTIFPQILLSSILATFSCPFPLQEPLIIMITLLIIIKIQHHQMIKYWRLSPLWNYLVENVSTLSPSFVNNAISINKNLMKGFVALQLYSDKHDKEGIVTSSEAVHLDDYDRQRITATFEMVPANLTGFERYQVSLQPLYIESIQSKGPKYYQYLTQLLRNGRVDIIDLYILINPNSTKHCFQFVSDNLIADQLPSSFLPHIQQMLLLHSHTLPYQLIIKIMDKLRLKNPTTQKLQTALRIKSLKENISKFQLQKISNEGEINHILSKIAETHENLLYAFFNDGEDISVVKKYIVNINTMVNFNQNISLELKVRIVEATRGYLALLPKRDVLREKVPVEEKRLKMELLKYEESMKGHMYEHIKRELEGSEKGKKGGEKRLDGEFLRNVRFVEVVEKCNLMKLEKWSVEEIKRVVNVVMGDPLLYLHYPKVFLGFIRRGVEVEYKVQDLQGLMEKFLERVEIGDVYETLGELDRLKQTLVKNKISSVVVQKVISRILSDNKFRSSPKTVSLQEYLKSAEPYNDRQNVEIILGDPIKLIGFLSTHELNRDYSLLSEEEIHNIRCFKKIVGDTKRKRIPEQQGLIQRFLYLIDGEQVVLSPTPLFSSIFAQFQEQQNLRLTNFNNPQNPPHPSPTHDQQLQPTQDLLYDLSQLEQQLLEPEQ